MNLAENPKSDLCVDQKEEMKPMAVWSDLPIDVLEHMTSFLALPDYHRFSAVCQNWWIAAKQFKQRHSSPAKQLPWLLFRGDGDPQKRRVFSISENRHYNIDFPELQGQHVCGSSYGWLFTVDIELNLKLLNPLMGKCYDLPPLLPISDRVKRFVRSLGPNGITFPYKTIQTIFVSKAIIDHDPAQRSDFTVFILSGFFRNMIFFWRPGTMVWTPMVDDSFSFIDIAYYKGKVYACTHRDTAIVDYENDTSVIHVVDVGASLKITCVGPEVPMCKEDEHCWTYLVDFRGELLLVQMRFLITDMNNPVPITFFVYKLDLEEGKYYPCHHLDGYSLFLGDSSPLVIDPSQFPSCKENCIYFVLKAKCINRDEYGIYDMLKGTVSPYYPSRKYHPDILRPIWWTPNPW